MSANCHLFSVIFTKTIMKQWVLLGCPHLAMVNVTAVKQTCLRISVDTLIIELRFSFSSSTAPPIVPIHLLSLSMFSKCALTRQKIPQRCKIPIFSPVKGERCRLLSLSMERRKNLEPQGLKPLLHPNLPSYFYPRTHCLL